MQRIDHFPPVLYLEGDGNYTRQHPRAGKSLIRSLTLRHMIDRHYPHLLRIHKRYAVDAPQIERLVRVDEKNYAVELVGGIRLSVSRRRLWAVKLAVGPTKAALVAE